MDIYEQFDRAIDKFVKKHPDSAYGPAHVILADKNIDKVYVYGCLPKLKKQIDQLTFKMQKKCDISDFARMQDELRTLTETFIFLSSWRRWLPAVDREA